MGAMTTKPPVVEETNKLVTREVGERVNFMGSIDPATVKDLGDGVFEAIITTAAVDRQSESIDTAGIDTGTYMDNPVVLYGHDYGGLPIGKTLKLTEMATKIKSRFQLAVQEYPFAATVAALMKGGYLNATSIGGIVKKWSDDFKTIEQMEMVEFSIVPVPANPQALITSRSLKAAIGKDIEQIEAEFKDFSRKILVDKVSDMGDDETSNAIKVLENLLATLKEAAQAHSKQEDGEIHRIKRVTLRTTARAVVDQSLRVQRTIKLKSLEDQDERSKREGSPRRRISLGRS